ncbi:hypothetical protein FA15DRAFT_590723, partial [Coprinopsis marcescibilis]
RVIFSQAFLLNSVLLAFIVMLVVGIFSHDFYELYPIALRIVFILTQDVVLGWASFIVLRSTIIPFFIQECRYRAFFGFQKDELLIRKTPLDLRPSSVFAEVSSRKPVNDQSEEDVFDSWRNAITHAIDPCRLYFRPGLMFSDDYWTPDYAATFEAARSIQIGELSMDDFDLSVWERSGASDSLSGMWNVVELWRASF